MNHELTKHKTAPNLAIIGLQWGDEGKGKIVDFLAEQFDAVLRFQGGHNAGHTIKVGGNTYKLSLLPSGVIRGKIGVIGSGVVVDPIALMSEIANIEASGINIAEGQLLIADNCPLILSLHRELDLLLEQQKGEAKIGTTGRGIGPAYEDLYGRRAIRICDLTDANVLKGRIENLLFYHNLLRKSLGSSELTVNQILQEIEGFRSKIISFAKPSFVISKQLQKLRVMFEGAQGALLDVSFGTFPFVTSSHTIAGQIGTGSTLGFNYIGETLGILKAYTTRVGSGPFPCELTCDTGEFLRTKGCEFGTVTGRNRRCGWLDLAVVRQSIELSAVKKIALTKIDVLSDLAVIKICTGYRLDGKIIEYLPHNIDSWQKLEPIYLEMPGWQQDISHAKTRLELPVNAQKYISKIEEISQVEVAIISTGPGRDQTIFN